MIAIFIGTKNSLFTDIELSLKIDWKSCTNIPIKKGDHEKNAIENFFPYLTSTLINQINYIINIQIYSTNPLSN